VTEQLFDRYFRFSAERLDALSIPEEAAAFLAQTGLPEWCAPNAHFGPIGDEWIELPLRQAGATHFVGLGEDRDDNLIALAIAAGDVWAIPDHGPQIYMASNVFEMSSAFHAYQTCINAAVAEDDQACVLARIPPRFLEPFVEWAAASNPRLLRSGAFWARELVRIGFPAQSLEVSGGQRPEGS